METNLLFGILALQNNFVDRSALLIAFDRWMTDRTIPLGQLLVSSGAMTDEERVLLDALADRLTRRFNGDVKQSLASLSSVSSICEALRNAGDPEVAASLDFLREPSEAMPREQTISLDFEDSHSQSARFRVIRLHAAGGLGEVFVARDVELGRDVALKRIKQSIAGLAECRQRFVLEAEITGGLEHPGIVPVYGLGHYADGRPFYAMRFVRGDSLRDHITRFHAEDGSVKSAGERSLELRQLLRRFNDVCNAMEYAHSRGVLHRDLKPGNIMLGKYGETLIVDWGLAKVGNRASNADSSEHSLLPLSSSRGTETHAGKVIGTPAYMSPEQAAGKLDELGPRSDVYSLGATLFTLLTGEPPFSAETVPELLAKVKRGEFAKPRQVNGQVAPALEAVCLKAMARNPSERYSGAKALADDIDHWLADEPVVAHRDPFLQRVSRWGRHHKAVVASMLVGLCAVTVSLAVGAVMLGREQALTEAQRKLAVAGHRAAKLAEAQERAQRKVAQKNAAAAEQQAQVAGEVSDFLSGLFRASDPIGFEGIGFRTPNQITSELTAKQLLDRGVARIDETNMSPEVQSQVLDVLATVYRNLGDFKKARDLMQKSLGLLGKVSGNESLGLANTLCNLGWLEFYHGNFRESEAHFRRALTIQTKLNADEVVIAKTKMSLGTTISVHGSKAVAHVLLLEALDGLKKKLGPRHRDVGMANVSFAIFEHSLGNNAAAALHLAEAASILDTAEGGSFLASVISEYQAGLNALRAGKFDEAQKAYGALMNKCSKELGSEHLVTAILMLEYAGALKQNGDLDSAEMWARRGFEILRGSMVRGHPKMIEGLLEYSDFLRLRKRHDESEATLREALGYCRERLPENDPLTVNTVNRLAQLLLDLERTPEAAELRDDPYGDNPQPDVR